MAILALLNLNNPDFQPNNIFCSVVTSTVNAVMLATLNKQDLLYISLHASCTSACMSDFKPLKPNQAAEKPCLC